MAAMVSRTTPLTTFSSLPALALLLSLLLASGGCGGESEPGGPATGGGSGAHICPAGQWQQQDGSCAPAGLPPDMPCPPAEWQQEDGTCAAAGVPPDGCGEGFVHDGDRGCEPILPDEPCPSGQLAAVGESKCHEVAPCGSGTWGDIPIEQGTVYVDQGYAGGNSAGTESAPFTTIGEAVSAAKAGAIVAIAAGSYEEDVTITGKPLRLWGRCPAMVELSGTGKELAAAVIFAGANGSEVRDIAITGKPIGLLLSGSTDVLLDRVWVHDTASRGINVEDALGPTSIVVTRSLVERSQQLGVFVAGSEATVQSCVIRDTLPDATGIGWGIGVQPNSKTGAPSSLTLTTSLIEQSQEFGVFGVFVEGSEATVQSSVIRDTLPDATGSGLGIGVQADPDTGAPSSLTLTTSLVEQSQQFGVAVTGSEATVQSSVIRDTLPDVTGIGWGISVQANPNTGAPSRLTLTTSLVERSQDVGVVVEGSQATVQSSVIRDTLPDAVGDARGVQVQDDSDTGAPSSVLLRGLLVERSGVAGVFVVDSTASLEGCLLRDTAPSASDLFGDGIVVYSEGAPASASLVGTRIEDSARAAVSSFGGEVSITGSVFQCQVFDWAGNPFHEYDYGYHDQGGNICGCPDATESCRIDTATIEPPEPVGGLE